MAAALVPANALEAQVHLYAANVHAHHHHSLLTLTLKEG